MEVSIQFSLVLFSWVVVWLSRGMTGSLFAGVVWVWWRLWMAAGQSKLRPYTDLWDNVKTAWFIVPFIITLAVNFGANYGLEYATLTQWGKESMVNLYVWCWRFAVSHRCRACRITVGFVFQASVEACPCPQQLVVHMHCNGCMLHVILHCVLHDTAGSEHGG